MGKTRPVWFSKINNHNATSKHDTNGGTWPWTMYLHISKIIIKAINKVIKDKTILQKFIHHTQRIVEWKTWWMCQTKNKCFFKSKTRSISRWKSLTKKKSTIANGWRWRRVTMVKVDGDTWVFGANPCIAQVYSPYMNKCPCATQ